MKRILSLVLLLGVIAVSNCTRVPDNNDPVIGIWTNTELKQTSDKGQEKIKEEWIFNDAYLGRYHRYRGEQIEFLTDFKWERSDEAYKISYPGTDMTTQTATMEETPEGTVLQDQDGKILAVRE